MEVVAGPRRFDGPPDLVVEVRSPSTWHLDRVVVVRRSSPASDRFDVSTLFDR